MWPWLLEAQRHPQTPVPFTQVVQRQAKRVLWLGMSASVSWLGRAASSLAVIS